MTEIRREDLHRTVKLEIDEGRARTFAEAEAMARQYRVQIAVGPNVAASATRQAMLLTAVNAACRAFLGGVSVVGDLTWPMTCRWARGASALEAVTSFGAAAGEDAPLDPAVPTIVIGDYDGAAGSVVMFATWQGWSGGVVDAEEQRLPEDIEFALAGVLAAGVAVGEAFQSARGNVLAGRRSAGLSLWSPTLGWREPAAWGEAVSFLPTSLWVLGLGHLGQAYLWALGFLPYPDPGDLELLLQDTDRVFRANVSTGLLSHEQSIGALKTRVCACSLEGLGFRTRLIERRFDETHRPAAGEPTWALAGFDNPAARRALGSFERAVDIGLGSEPDDYLALRLHALPAAGDPVALFAREEVPRRRQLAAPAYDDLERALLDSGAAAGDARCGVIEVAGAAVGAAFVGTVAGALGVGTLLRALADDDGLEVLAVSLAAPDYVDAAFGLPGPPSNPGYVAAGPP